MTVEASDTVLERKARAQRKARNVGAVSIPRALGRGLSIAADALWGLGLGASLHKDDTLETDVALDRVSDDQLLIVIECENRAAGLVAIDRDLVTGLIEVQTLGKVTRFPLDSRAFTPTDAAMMAPLIDAALPRFASMLAGQPEMSHLQGYSFGALVEDRQTGGLALDAPSYQVIMLDISLAQGTRKGRMVFLLPEAEKPADGDDKPGSEGRHAATLKLVPARMQAVLTRIHIPLDKAQSLKPGDVLAISPEAINSAMLVVNGGHIAARGKMGQMNGFRAVRIGAASSPLHQPAAPQKTDMVSAPDDVPQQPRIAPPSQTENIDFGISLDTQLDDLAASLSDP
ncbi:FliM/FliN family flagellar motor C-terminal domain-containing protein [Marivita sp. S2033]|uniref:flagellar motor switch protein FliM n=1 Tax=Marivita sp. S2033 TaxID=3373187 RepID=UPI00398267A2